tara:strand:- start:237 stop:404 length:168 start_codon:yes stop_codon:yes gene_type:complete
MKQPLTLQTAAAFERILESLKGKTEDELDFVISNLEQLIIKANQIKTISVEINHS